MQTFMYVEINIIGIVLVVIMLLNVKDYYSKYASMDQKLFKCLLVVVMIIFIFDTGMWVIDGKTFQFARELNYITTIIYLISNPVACFFGFFTVIIS